MAYSIARQRTAQNNPFSFFFWMILICAVVVMVVYGVHAIESHGRAVANTVRTCLTNNGTLEVWYNPSTGREARLCQINKGTFGIMIVERGREVTSFIKNKLHRLDQIYRYLENTGYVPK